MGVQTSLAAKNRNPLNIRPLMNGQTWTGQTGVSRNSATGAFCVFDSNESGIRAAVINLRSYVRAGVSTLRGAIYRWAPPVDETVGTAYQNHTVAYLDKVCKHAGVTENFSLGFLMAPNHPSAMRYKLALILQAMNLVEAGGPTVTLPEIEAGIERALGPLPAQPATLMTSKTGVGIGAGTVGTTVVAPEAQSWSDSLYSMAEGVLPDVVMAMLTPGIIKWSLIALAVSPLVFVGIRYAIKSFRGEVVHT
jgi:hypothetical protein